MAILVSILVYLLVKGLPQLSWSFFKGIAPTVVGTLFVTFIAVLIAIPLGVGAAFFLAEYTKQNVFTRIIRFSIESLAGIPSIVYGLFGFTFFVINLGMRYSVLAGGLTLAIMILPTIIRTTEEAIKAVPNSLRETSYSLGATKWQTIRKVVFPSAMSGIVNGIILSIGRCVAETAAIMLTLGVVLKTPASLFDSGRTMASHFYLLVMENPDDVSAFGVAVLLIFSILLINIVANTLVNRFVSKNERRSKKFKKGGGYAAKSTLAAKD
ncbi:MAG: phosphate ABC transporter permease PstA [Firmicutes bacterium]|nr:phosphate ABC transporter permease PstA [Bacillota bacterium]